MLKSLQLLVSDALVVDADGDPLGGVDHIEIDGDGMVIVLDTSAADECDDPDGGEEADEPEIGAKLRAISGDKG